jgi:hypothetical protein
MGYFLLSLGGGGRFCSRCQITCLHLFGFLWCCPLRFPCKNDVFTPICFVRIHALFTLFGIYLRIFVSNMISISDDVRVL